VRLIRNIASIGCFVGFILLVLNLAQADTQPPKIKQVKGTVTYRVTANEPWKNAEVGVVLGEGSEIRTGLASLCEVTLDEDPGNIFRIESDSRASIVSLEPFEIEIHKGTMLTLLENLKPGSTFKVRSPAATAVVRGTGWGQSAGGQFCTFSGSVGVSASSGAQMGLGQGNCVNVGADGNFGEVYEIPDELWDLWKAWLESMNSEGNFNKDFEGNGDWTFFKDDAREIQDDQRILDAFDRMEETGDKGGYC